ncbi:prolyl oligopeptidase family serine peptidase [Entomobacter blattae]|uniref:prolyl oligopeptidase n=1 Tax=Entomobacter blattae TaxID=2762277 RepID=A0A7H1NPP6_9PROT|nr:prolyl oligopeptidase family serine peptidase [Entomobacter blattae]QNT77756.1 Prolyl endopeptidase [Entomobacter blattae]
MRQYRNVLIVWALGLLGMAYKGEVVYAADQTAPVTTIQPVEENFFGDKVTDPYPWLGISSSPEVKAWDKAQNRRTQTYLSSLPQRKKLYTRFMAAATQTSGGWKGLRVAGERVFAQTRLPSYQQPVIVNMDLSADPHTQIVSVNPNLLDPSGHTAIDWFVPSPDGKWVAVSLSKNGSEIGELHIFDARTGKETKEVPISHVQYPTAGGSVAWRADSTGFWYTRYPEGNLSNKRQYFNQQIWYHSLGKKDGEDRYVFGRDLPKIAEIRLDNSQNALYTLISVENGDGGEFAHYVMDSRGHIRQITHFADHVTAASIGPDNVLYLLSYDHAPKGKILAMSLDGSAADLLLSRARLLIPESDYAIQGEEELGGAAIVVTADNLYLKMLDGGPVRVGIYTHNGKPKGMLPVGKIASVSDIVSTRKGQVLYAEETYLTPQAIVRYDEQKGKSEKTKLVQKTPVSFKDIDVIREFAFSKDGTKIPLNILRKKGRKLNKETPAILCGYGGYGISLVPHFAGIGVKQWVEAGGIYVVANLRGGAEYGALWHQMGQLEKKQTVFDDFLASAHYMVQKHYTSPQHLAIIGASNGGLLVGAALTQEPTSFRAVVGLEGIYDLLHAEYSPNGAFNATELGTVENKSNYEKMKTYSPYQNITEGKSYPAVLLMMGLYDGRVSPEQSRKMTARLQAATASGFPVYLSVSESTGHGNGLSYSIGQMADYYAFIYDQLGLVRSGVKKSMKGSRKIIKSSRR